jgi:hypothetical protein
LDEVWNEDCLVPKFQQSPICVMMWGCIAYGHKGPLIVLEYPGGKGGGMTTLRYQQQVLLSWIQCFSLYFLSPLSHLILSFPYLCGPCTVLSLSLM